jgi:hypothetical protein
MNHVKRLFLVLGLAGASVAGLGACAGLLMQPGPNQPHATLEVHHVVNGMQGDSYDTRLLINDRLYDTRSFSEGEIDTNPVSVRLALEAQTVTVAASTYHSGTGPSTGTEERREEYACQREQCTTDSPPVCTTVNDTCFRTHTVPTYSSGTSASRSEECTASVQIAPDVQRRYYIEFTYESETQCSAACYQRQARADGSYERTPCPTAYTTGD